MKKTYKGLNGISDATMRRFRARRRKEEAKLRRRVTVDELLNILLSPKKLPVRSVEGV